MPGDRPPQQCPWCRLVSPGSAERCDCGYLFDYSGAQRQARVAAWRRPLARLVFAAAALVLSVWILGERVVNPLTEWDRDLHPRYRSIRSGMAKESVVHMLGKPRDEGSEFRLSQQDGFERQYEQAARSNARYWLFWYNGIDVTYAVGFDRDGSVAMTAWGGT